MKKLNLFFTVLAFSMLTLSSCDQFKSEDSKIGDVLIGKSYEEDREDENGVKTKDIKSEYFKDGKFLTKATFENTDLETLETNDISIEVSGKWEVKDRFIYYTYDYDKLKITPDFYMSMKDELIKSLKDKNTPDKVIEYDASKIIYENSDGKRYTMKKSY